MAKKAASPKLSDAEQVDQWMAACASPLKEEIEQLRKIIKKVDAGISERIKWNAPSYHYNGTDILTFGPERKGKLLLVFHHPFIVNITSDLLEGDYKDRRLVYFEDAKGIKAAKAELERIVREHVTELTKKK